MAVFGNVAGAGSGAGRELRESQRHHGIKMIDLKSLTIKKAREMLKSGIIGAAIVLGVGVIIQTVASIVTRNFFGGWFY